jgi:hypothetical protein
MLQLAIVSRFARGSVAARLAASRIEQLVNPGSTPSLRGKAPRMSRPDLIGGLVVGLSMLCLVAACGSHQATPPSGASGGAPVASADAAGPPAAAPSGVQSAAGGNPILGRWTLVDTSEAAYCQSSQEFTADSGTSVLAGKTSTGHPIYDVKPTFVYVSYGGPNTEQWNVNGPDDLTLELVSPYSVTSCRYHRA